jgi:hypothetical protein
LGIPAEALAFVQMMTGPVGVYIWDLDSGNTYTVLHEQGQTSVLRGQRDVPQHVKEIISAETDDLKKRWKATMGWDDARETIFSELRIRGVDILALDFAR